MKTSLELAKDAGIYLEGYEAAADRFAALIEQRHTQQLLGAKVEPSAWVDEFGNAYPLSAHTVDGKPLRWDDAHKRGWKPLYTAEQCAAMVAQATPKLLEALKVARTYVDAVVANATGAAKRKNYQQALRIIDDALGVKEQL